MPASGAISSYRLDRGDPARPPLDGGEAQVHQKSNEVFQRFIVELVVLTLLIVALVISLVILRKRAADAVEAVRAT